MVDAYFDQGVNESTQTLYLSDALKDDCFSWFVELSIFYFNFLDILVNPCKPSKPGEKFAQSFSVVLII